MLTLNLEQAQETETHLQIPAHTGPGRLTNREAVIFWVGRILEKIQADGFPPELGMIGVVAMPFLGKIAAKVEGISEESAADIIRSVHSLSFRLEEQTGEFSPFHYEHEADREPA